MITASATHPGAFAAGAFAAGQAAARVAAGTAPGSRGGFGLWGRSRMTVVIAPPVARPAPRSWATTWWRRPRTWAAAVHPAPRLTYRSGHRGPRA